MFKNYNENHIKHVLNMTREEALGLIASIGMTANITEEDGVSYPMTAEFNPNRINLILKDNKVSDFYIG